MAALVSNFSKQSTPASRSAYANALPFAHGVVTHIADPAFLRSCRAELEQLGFTPKETDLYKLSQSRDLANLAAEDATLVPHLMKLRTELYSDAFRTLIAEHTGCGPLSSKVDLAGAVYNSGSHLLVHDDVVSTRRIAFIIYLTKEEDNWSIEDGGCLELFSSEADSSGKFSVPVCVPAQRIRPLFNHFAFFTVAAGKSFHAVQEVYAPAKDRVSLQGWFHTADARLLKSSEPTVAELRALASNDVFLPHRLAVPVVTMPKKAKANLKKGPPAPQIPQVDITDTTLNELRELGVHPMYLDRDNLGLMIHAMKKEGVVRMSQFLVPDLVTPVTKLLRTIDEADALGLGQPTPPCDDAGVHGRWTRVGPPHIRRYLVLAPEATESGLKKSRAERSGDAAAESREELAGMLDCIRENLMESAAFATFVAAIAAAAFPVGTALGDRATCVRRFRPGLDFSLASVPAEVDLLDARLTLCCDPVADDDDESDKEEAPVSGGDEETEEQEQEEDGDDEEENEDLWDSCEAGGFDSYIKADEDRTAGAVAALDSDAVMNLPCQNNTLSIAIRKTNVMHFVKYVQAIAPSSRIDATTTFKVIAPAA